MLGKVRAAGENLPRALVRSAIQEQLNLLRAELAGGGSMPDDAALENRIADAVTAAGKWRLQRVINATGVILHTNLGRAPLGGAMSDHVARIASGYSTLEYSLSEGARGSRHDLVERQLCRITGAEAAMVVNNNAAAVFLMLNTVAAGRRVIVSRGELVEIGGAFRVPEIMKASGAELCEIGTTNKTHPSDYRSALDADDACAILKVHASNFKIVGFSEEVGIDDLREIAAEHNVPLLYDLGAGFMVRPESLGLRDGIYVPNAVKCADVCCFSGDKLFGAGQAGILLGRADLIERMKKNQLARMLRVDKMTLAALEAALRLYEDADMAKERIPVLKMLSIPQAELKRRAERLADALTAACGGLRFAAVPCQDEPGGGALPTVLLDGWAVAVEGENCDRLDAYLRACPVPIVARISKDRLLVSVRTLMDGDETDLADAFRSLEVRR